MNDDRIQPERHFPGPFDEAVQPRRAFPPDRPRYEGSFGDRVFARRDFQFWDPATVSAVSAFGVTVLFDDMEEAALDPADTVVFDLKERDLVFIRHGHGLLGGWAARILRFFPNAVEVQAQFGDFANTYFLSELRIYAEPVAVPWNRGDHVLAYQPSAYKSALPLWLPGVVHDLYDFPCVGVDFANGDQSLVPASLVQTLDLKPGLAPFYSHRALDPRRHLLPVPCPRNARGGRSRPGRHRRHVRLPSEPHRPSAAGLCICRGEVDPSRWSRERGNGNPGSQARIGQRRSAGKAEKTMVYCWKGLDVAVW